MRVKRIIETLCIEKHLSWVSNTVNNLPSAFYGNSDVQNEENHEFLVLKRKEATEFLKIRPLITKN